MERKKWFFSPLSLPEFVVRIGLEIPPYTDLSSSGIGLKSFVTITNQLGWMTSEKVKQNHGSSLKGVNKLCAVHKM